MKKIAMLGLVLFLCMGLAGCEREEKTDENDKAFQEEAEEEQAEEKDVEGLEIENGEAKVFSLYTDDKSASIQVKMLAGYEESDYSSEVYLAFQCPQDGSENMTQLNLRLVTDSEENVMTTAQQEVQYLLSANSDGDGTADEVQSITEGEKQWSYFGYSLEGLEGCRIWTSLGNGCVLSCTIESLGTEPEPLNIDSLVQELNAAIQE